MTMETTEKLMSVIMRCLASNESNLCVERIDDEGRYVFRFS